MMTNKPHDRIYLQCCNDGEYIGHIPGSEVTWCQDMINQDDIEYVRADVAEQELATLRQRAAGLEGHLVDVLLENKPTDATCQCFSNDDNCAWHRARKAVLSAYEAATAEGGE